MKDKEEKEEEDIPREKQKTEKTMFAQLHLAKINKKRGTICCVYNCCRPDLLQYNNDCIDNNNNNNKDKASLHPFLAVNIKKI
jgi:hypothetical protein